MLRVANQKEEGRSKALYQKLVFDAVKQSAEWAVQVLLFSEKAHASNVRSYRDKMQVQETKKQKLMANFVRHSTLRTPIFYAQTSNIIEKLIKAGTDSYV